MNGKTAAGVFTRGSTMRHVIVMSATGSVGLMAIFLVDIANLFYISLLGQQELAAAIGYASTIMFFTISFGIGLSIAATALVARALGRGDIELARKRAATSLVFVFVVTALIAAMLFPALGMVLSWIGAKGATHTIAVEFMQIVIPSVPLVGLGMCLAGLLRAQGDATRAMHVTLSAAVVAAILDPILIIYLDLGITGAAIATVFTRLSLVGVGLWGTHFVHHMIGRIDLNQIIRDFGSFFTIAIPAVVTQIATPIGNAYVTANIAEFGDDAVAGWAIVGRIIPLAFGAVFALSGAVGPILSQNYGARLFDRVNETLRDALVFALIYSIVMWGVLALTQDYIIQMFSAKADAAELIAYFCLIVAGSFIFNGALFVANAAFNNLGFPLYATFFNWGRATLGVIPFVYIGKSYGAEGILAGWGLGGVIFGVAAVIVSFRLLTTLPAKAEMEDLSGQDQLPVVPSGQSPFTTGKGASAG